VAKSGDLSGQLLLCSATASPAQLEELAAVAVEKGKNNVAFVCLFLLNKIDDCIALLCDTVGGVYSCSIYSCRIQFTSILVPIA
jgi:coatomer subunit beta'